MVVHIVTDDKYFVLDENDDNDEVDIVAHEQHELHDINDHSLK